MCNSVGVEEGDEVPEDVPLRSADKDRALANCEL